MSPVTFVPVTFVPVSEDHRSLLQHWLAQPHWRTWWGDPVVELRMIYAVADGEHEPYIAFVGEEPMAYIQAWWPTKHPDLPWQFDLSPTTRGIDMSIGEAKHLGRGHGPAIVRAFAAKLFDEGATRLVIDPDKTNPRAIQAYRKAGFLTYGETEHNLLMEMREPP